MNQRDRHAVGAILLATTVAAVAADARTLAVPDDYATVGDALREAVAGDFVLVGCGTYREHDLRVPAGVSLWSATLKPDCTVIDAGGRGRVLEFVGCDSTTAVVGLTLRGGRTTGDGGLVHCRDASPRLARCRLEGGRAARGGAIACTGARGPVLEDCVITGNTAEASGGGVSWQAVGTSRLTRCVIADNVAPSGGGVALSSAGELRLEDCTVVDNVAGAAGGGVWLEGGRLDARDCVIVRNDAGLAGSAVACVAGRTRLRGCTLADNASDEGGAALLMRQAALDAGRTLLAFNRPAVLVGEPDGPPVFTRCNVYGHPTGDWTGALGALGGRPGNFSADPRFCERNAGRYDLRADSPCLPGGSAGTTDVLIGALGQGCE